MKQINVKLLAILFLTSVVTLGAAFILHRFQQRRNADGLLKRAEQRLKEEKYSDASRLLHAYVKRRPEDSQQQYVALANTLVKQVDQSFAAGTLTNSVVSRAYGMMDEAVRRNPDNVKLRESAATFSIRIARFSYAIKHLEWLLNGDTSQLEDEGELRVQLAVCHARTSEDKKAVQELAKIIGFDLSNGQFTDSGIAPDNIDAYILLANLFRNRQQQDKLALAVLDRLIKANPESFEARIRRAQFLNSNFKDVQFSPEMTTADIVTADVQAALRFAPDEQDVLLFAGGWFSTQKNFREAEKHFRHCQELYPDNVGAYRGLAGIAEATKDPSKAIEFLEQGLKVDPENRILLWAQANYELDQKKYEDVEETKRRLQSLKHPQHELDFLDARVLFAKEKWVDASKAFDAVRPQISQYKPEWLNGLDTGLAQCYERLKQNDLRLKVCSRLVDNNPSNLKARWWKMQSLLALNRHDDALKEYDYVEKQLSKMDGKVTSQNMAQLLQLELMQQKRKAEPRRDYSDARAMAKEIYDRGMLKDPEMARVIKMFFIATGQEEKVNLLDDSLKKQNPNSLSYFVADVRERLNEQGAEAAIEMIEKELPRFNNDRNLRLMLCDLLARTDRPRSLSMLKQIETEVESQGQVQRTQTIRGLGKVYSNMGELGETSRLWQRLLKESPQDIQVRLSVFELAVLQDDDAAIDKGIDLVEELVTKDSAEYKWCLATKLVRSFNKKQAKGEALDQAQLLLSEAIAQREGWALLHRLQGDIHRLRNDTAGAIEALERSVKGDFQAHRTFIALARLYFQQQNFEMAERRLSQVPPALWGVRDRRMHMTMLARKGQLPKELPYNAESDDPSEHEWVGMLLANAGRMDEAETALRKAIELGPSRVTAWSALGEKLVRNRETEKVAKLMAAAEQHLSELDTIMFRAEVYARFNEFEKAAGLFKKAAALAPDDMAVKRAFVDLSFKTGNTSEAELVLEEMTQLGASSDPAILRNVKWARQMKARVVASQGTYQAYRQAIQILKENAGEKGLSPDDLIVWGELALGRPDGYSRDEAIDQYIATEATRPLTSRENRILANLFHNQDRWSECKSVMVNLLTTNSRDPQLLNSWLGWLLEHDEVSEARTWLKKCDPKSITAVRTLAELETRANNGEDAAKRLAAMIPSDLPTEKAAQVRSIAMIYEHLGKFDKRMFRPAEKTYRRYVKMVPKGKLLLAGFLGRRGTPKDLDEAVSICAQEIENGNADIPLRLLIGVLRENRSTLSSKQSFVQSVDSLFQKTMTRFPDRPSVLVQRSEFEDIVGRPDEAQRWLKKYMELDNLSEHQRAVAANNLAYMMAHKGDTQGIDEYVGIAVKVLGPTADLRDTIGMVHYAKGEFDSAIREFEATTADGGATPFKYLHLSMAYLAAGRGEKAALAYKQAHEKDFDSGSMNKLELKSYQELTNKLKAANLIAAGSDLN